MNFETFRPFVTPYVRTLPDVTIEHHVRQAAIAFCARTLVWSEELAPVLTQVGVDVIPLTIDGDTALAKLLNVWVDGIPYDVQVTKVARPRARAGALYQTAYVASQDTVRIAPVPDIAGLSIVVEAVLKPSIDCVEIPDALAEFTEDIANGALATLLMLKGEDRDPQQAGYHQAVFGRRIAVVGHRVSKGMSSARTGRGARNFF